MLTAYVHSGHFILDEILCFYVATIHRIECDILEAYLMGGNPIELYRYIIRNIQATCKMHEDF
jgi:hypothetical protein